MTLLRPDSNRSMPAHARVNCLDHDVLEAAPLDHGKACKPASYPPLKAKADVFVSHHG
jgi:hypothetical protein